MKERKGLNRRIACSKAADSKVSNEYASGTKMSQNRGGRIFLIALAIIAILAGCSPKAQETAVVQLTPVEAGKVTKGDMQSVYTMSGKVKPLKEVAVVPKIPGKVEGVYKELGDPVAEGEKLFVIETKDLVQQLGQLDAQLLQSDAGVDLAEINLDRMKGSSLQQQLMQSETAMRQAEISYNAARTEYENNKKLYEADAVSKQVLDAAKDKFELAQVQYQNARNNYELLKNKIAAESIDTAETQVKQAQAGKSALQTQKEMVLQKIEDSVVTSPIAGVVAQRDVEKGTMASQQLPAFTIVDIDSVIVEASVTEKMINRLAKGQEVVVAIKSLEGRKFKGVIDAISPSVTSQSAGYPVKIIIENKKHEIKPGMFAVIDFVTEIRKGIPLVPMEAVLSDKGKSIVFVLDGDISKKREVKTGIKDGKYIEISSGLAEGEQVIIKGQQYVVDGEKVQVAGGTQP